MGFYSLSCCRRLSDRKTTFSSGTSDLDPFEGFLYSAVLAASLEFIPTYAGRYLHALIDTTTYKKNDKRRAWIGLGFSIAGFLLAIILVIVMRYESIQRQGGKDFYLKGDYDMYIRDCFLMWSPFLTSILAFVASWFSQQERVAEVKKEADRLYRIYQQKYRLFLDKLHSLHEARTYLWTTVTNHKKIPKTLEAYRYEVVCRIRSLLINNSVTAFSSQLKMYNEAVEAALSSYLEEMGSYSTLPAEITSIDISEIIKEYDQNQNNEDSPWGYERAEADLIKELQKLCDNEILIEQVKIRKESE